MKRSKQLANKDGEHQPPHSPIPGCLGIIETQGRAPLIETVDTAIKAASVNILASYFVGGGCNTVTLVGDVGSVRAALDAARVLMDKKGFRGCTHLIPRLDKQVWPLIMPGKGVPNKEYGTV